MYVPALVTLMFPILFSPRTAYRGERGAPTISVSDFQFALLTLRVHFYFFRIPFLGKFTCDHGNWLCLVLDQYAQLGVLGGETVFNVKKTTTTTTTIQTSVTCDVRGSRAKAR